jgi:hypothetical protein
VPSLFALTGYFASCLLRFDLKINKGYKMDLLKAVQEKKSIRAFKSDPIPKEKMEGIIRLAIHTPSAINLQPREFVGYCIAPKLGVPFPEFEVIRIGESFKRNYFSHHKDEEIEVRAGLATGCKTCQDPSPCNYSSGEFL